jgi:hypothetical protein
VEGGWGPVGGEWSVYVGGGDQEGGKWRQAVHHPLY